jgi:hypothetical protein
MEPGEHSPADGAPDNMRPQSGRHQGPHRPNVYLNDLKDRYTEIFRTTARSSAARRGTSAGASLASYSNPT